MLLDTLIDFLFCGIERVFVFPRSARLPEKKKTKIASLTSARPQQINPSFLPNMADQLDMNRMSLQDSQHASNGANGFPGGRSAYVPPHARQASRSTGMDNSSWGDAPQK